MELREAQGIYIGQGAFDEAWECTKLIWDEEKDREVVLKFREGIKKAVSEENLVLYRKSYDLCARDSFDDFMLALEWNREPEQQFWLPRRQKLYGICECLQDLEDGKLDELFISQPPRTGKSTLVQFFVLWVILRHPQESSLYCTYTESVAKVFYNGLLEILNDPWTYRWKELFPEREIASTDAKELLLNIDKKNKYASFTGRSLYGSLTGATNASAGGYLIADDLHSGVEEALNPDLLNTAWARVTNNFLSRNSGKARQLWIGTRWSLKDCIARRIDLLENDPQFKDKRFRIINVPALNEEGESNFDYAFGRGFSTQYFQETKAGFERNGDIASWDAQFMGLPIERSGSVFEPDSFRYYNGVLPEDVEPDRIFVVVDPSWGGGDYCAAVCLYQYDEDLYVHDLVYDNGDKRITQPLIARMCVKHQASAVYVEATKTTNSYSQGLNDLIREYGYRVNMISTTKHWAGNKSKQQRIFDRAPDIRETMIFRDVGYRDRAYQKFMENVFEFKIQGKNQHDDAPDVLAQAIVSAVIGDAKAVIRKRFF